MGKKAVKRRTSDDPALNYLPGQDAKMMLYNSMLSIGWRLAIAVLGPVFLGIWLDKRYDTKPSYTLTAFFIAIAMSGVLIAKMYKEIVEQSKNIKYPKTTKKVKDSDYDNNDY